jgi:hypothetical protein
MPRLRQGSKPAPKDRPGKRGVGGRSAKTAPKLKQAETVPEPRPVSETLISDLNDPHRKRGTYALLQRAIDVAMDIPFDAMRLASVTAVRDLSSNDDRIRSRAREFLLKVQDSGIGAAVGLDRIGRLDEGMATENVAVAAITPEALAAVVQTIRHTARITSSDASE